MLIWLLPLSLFVLVGLVSWQGALWQLWLLISFAIPFILLLLSLGKSPWQKRLRLSTASLLALHLAGTFGLWVTAETDWWRTLIFIMAGLILLFWAAELRVKKETGAALASLQILTFIFGIFGLVTGLGAFSALVDYSPWWLLLGAAVLASGGIFSLFALFNIHISHWWLWAAVANFLLLELAGLIWYLPLGAYTQGALAALLTFGLLINFDIPKTYSGFTRALIWIAILATFGATFLWSVTNIF